MASLRKSIKEAAVGVHKLGIRMGVHVLPVHYYSPVPNILELRRNQAVWAKPSSLPGIRVDLDEQMAFLADTCRPYQFEYKGHRTYLEGQEKHFGPGYGPIESQALHGVIRKFKPRRVVEVGSGVSTYCMAKAMAMNVQEGAPAGSITCIEPYPSEALKAMTGIELVAAPVQQADLSVFTSLQAGDLLFIDSSHAVRPGGDVNFLMLEVLPRLNPGVMVHIHDIYLPFDHQRDVCNTFFHWTETSLVRAFLTHNPKVRILACMSHLHYERTQAMRMVFPDYKPQENDMGMELAQYGPTAPAPGHFPSSLYLQML